MHMHLENRELPCVVSARWRRSEASNQPFHRALHARFEVGSGCAS
jgi:hypothetical protein